VGGPGRDSVALMSRRTRIALVVVAALVVGLGLWLWRRVWPWVAEPDASPAEIEARWAAVEEVAGRYGEAPATSPRLQAASAAWNALDRDSVPADDRRGAAVDPDALDPAVRGVIDELVAWAEEEGDVADTCVVGPARLDVVALSRIGRLALRSAVAPDDLPFTAALRLATALRQRGPLLAGVIGFDLADRALAVARARGWDVRDALAGQRPTEDELRALVARESVCSYRTISSVFADGCGAGELAPPWYYPFSAARWCERERLVFMDFHGRLHARALAEPDLGAFAAVFDDTGGERPASLVLRAVEARLGAPIRGMSESLARFDAALAGSAVAALAAGDPP